MARHVPTEPHPNPSPNAFGEGRGEGYPERARRSSYYQPTAGDDHIHFIPGNALAQAAPLRIFYSAPAGHGPLPLPVNRPCQKLPRVIASTIPSRPSPAEPRPIPAPSFVGTWRAMSLHPRRGNIQKQGNSLLKTGAKGGRILTAGRRRYGPPPYPPPFGRGNENPFPEGEGAGVRSALSNHAHDAHQRRKDTLPC
jgi:hypothetical protein